MANSHLKTLKLKSNQISHEGTPLDEFESNFMREPSYSWNPPIRTNLIAMGKNYIDDCFNFDDVTDATNDINVSFEAADIEAGGLTTNQRTEFRLVHGDSPSGLFAGEDLSLNNHTDNNNASFESSVIETGGLTTSQSMDFRPVRGDSHSGLLAGEILSSNNPTDDNNDSFKMADNDARGLTTNQRMEFCPVCGDSTSRLHAGENLLTNNLRLNSARGV